MALIWSGVRLDLPGPLCKARLADITSGKCNSYIIIPRKRKRETTPRRRKRQKPQNFNLFLNIEKCNFILGEASTVATA